MQLEGCLQVEQFPQHDEEEQLVRQCLDALDCIHELDCGLLGVLKHLSDHVFELLLVFLRIFGFVLREYADQQLLIGAVFSDDCFVEGF